MLTGEIGNPIDIFKPIRKTGGEFEQTTNNGGERPKLSMNDKLSIFNERAIPDDYVKGLRDVYFN
jgi:hypothetical protein